MLQRLPKMLLLVRRQALPLQMQTLLRLLQTLQLHLQALRLRLQGLQGLQAKAKGPPAGAYFIILAIKFS